MKLCKIRKEGGSRVVNVSKILPQDWQYVELMTLKTRKKNVVIVQFEKVS